METTSAISEFKTNTLIDEPIPALQKRPKYSTISNMNTWITALTATTLISLISVFVAFFFFIRQSRQKFIMNTLVGFAAGALLGDTVIHILPEVYTHQNSSIRASILILAGVLVFFCLEKFLHWRHCHHEIGRNHKHAIATMNIFGDTLHNLIDGLLIGSSFLISIPIGLSTTAAVILHEIPQEIGDFGIMLYSGFRMRKAILVNFATGIIAIVGTIISLGLGGAIHGYSEVLLPITAGGFLYIAASDLLPELKHEDNVFKSLTQLFSVLGGMLLMVLLKYVE